MNVYEKAWSALEAADRKAGRAARCVRPDKVPHLLLDEWTCAHAAAKRAADSAVAESADVQKMQRLVDKAAESASLRGYAKAVAARVATAEAVWSVAYGRAMPKKFKERP